MDRKKRMKDVIQFTQKRYIHHIQQRVATINSIVNATMNKYYEMRNLQYLAFNIKRGIIKSLFVDHHELLHEWSIRYHGAIQNVQHKANNYSDQRYGITGNFFAKCFEQIYSVKR